MPEGWRGRIVPGLVLVVGMLLVTHAPARAAGPTEQLRTQVDRVIKTLEDPELKKDAKHRERRVAVRKIAEEIFDFGETARRSLGTHWAARTVPERREFVQLFTDLLERSYLTKIEVYGGERVGYLAESIDGDAATVKTRIVTKNGTEIPVDYKMLKRGADRWLVYDVSIEGISLVSNYRMQFNKIIQTSSYQELVKKLKIKQDEFVDQDRRQRTSQR